MHAQRAEWAQELLRGLEKVGTSYTISNSFGSALSQSWRRRKRLLVLAESVYRARGDDVPYHSSLLS